MDASTFNININSRFGNRPFARNPDDRVRVCNEGVVRPRAAILAESRTVVQPPQPVNTHSVRDGRYGVIVA